MSMGIVSKRIQVPRCKIFMLFLWIYFSAVASASRNLALITAQQGHIVGQLGPETGIFWGIPFSQPPVGEWRWKNPRDPIAFKEKYWNATFKRPGCMQACQKHPELLKYACPSTTSEDCLFLNVFLPKRIFKLSASNTVLGQKSFAVADKYTRGDCNALAVMVYLHGGNFVEGAGSAMLYDGRFLAHRGDVVVVTINYRLGPLGFLVQGTGKDAARGNYGIQDQIKALQWVKKNIKHFGGNPKKVTLFGQSAGGESIGILMTSSLSKELFQKAIFESDPLSLPYRTMSDANKFGRSLAQKLHCLGDISCMRKIDANKIVLAAKKTKKFSLFTSGKVLFGFQPWGPVIDGNLMLKHPMQSFREGKFHQMPVIMGDNTNDAFLYVNLAFPGKISSFMYQLIMGLIANGNANAILQEYPQCSSLTCDNKATVSKLSTDFVFMCPARRVMLSLRHNSWFYIFNASEQFKGIWKSSVCYTGSCHGAELVFVFGTSRLASLHLSDDQTKLSHKIQSYWTNFAKYGNPNGNIYSKTRKSTAKVEHWDRFLNSHNGAYKALELTPHGNHVVTNPRMKNCNFWDKMNLYGKL